MKIVHDEDTVYMKIKTKSKHKKIRNKRVTWFDRLIDGPISSKFRTDEEIKKRSRVRRQKIGKGIKKVTKIAKEGLDIYYHMREKNFVSIGLGTLSALGVVSDNLIDGGNMEVEDVLHDLDCSMLYNGMLNTFIRNTYKRMNIIPTIYWDTKDDNNSSVIEEYDINGYSVYFINQQDYVEGPYVDSRERFIESTSSLIKEKFGKYILLSTENDEGWSKHLCLGVLPDYEDKVYVSLLDENKLVGDLKTFFSKGLNRSLIFCGPPGSGKTTLALRLCKSLEGQILVLNGWSLSRKSTGSVYNIIEVVNPSIILFDDLDRISGAETLLGDLESLNKTRDNKRRLFIATVNNLERLPSALIRPGRFDQVIYFDKHQDISIRKKILLVHAENMGIKLSERELDWLAEITTNLTGAYLREVIIRISVLGLSGIDKHIEDMRSLLNKHREIDYGEYTSEL